MQHHHDCVVKTRLLAQVNGVSMDHADFTAILALIERARDAGGWLVLAGHDVDVADSRLVTDGNTLRAICEYAMQPEHGVWLDTMAAVAEYIQAWRQENTGKGDKSHGS